MTGPTVYWKGRMATEEIEFEHAHEQILLSDRLEKMREDIWRKTVQKYPDVYDGDILVLDAIATEKQKLMLHTKEIKFSRVLVLEKVGKGLGQYGTMGLQVAVFSNNRQYLLYGERSHTEMYCPGLYSLPGGMLEVKDAKQSFDSACMRELKEEVSIEVRGERHLIGIVKDLHSSVGITLIVEGVARKKPQAGEQVHGNEEWREKMLMWHDIDSLASLGESEVLSGLLFLKEEIPKFQ